MSISTGNTPGRRRAFVVLQNPGPSSPDGEGGFSFSWVDLVPPTAYAAIEVATQAGLERLTSGTITSQAQWVVTLPYHAQVTTQTRVIYNAHILSVLEVHNVDLEDIEQQLICSEVVL